MSERLTVDEPKASNRNHDASPLLLTSAEAAAMCRVGERTWRTWDVLGKIPSPIRIGRKVFWRPAVIRAWIAADCPDRETWELRRR